MAPADRDRALREICDRRLVIKHCYENLSADFNHAFAELSTKAGYRHIHLVRRDELARLVSKGVAEQQGTWGAHDWTRERFARLRESGRALPSLDVPMLKRYHEECQAKWSALEPLLRGLQIVSEDLFRDPGPSLRRVAHFLRMPEHYAVTIAANLGRGHGTQAIWKLIPNIEQLRNAITA